MKKIEEFRKIEALSLLKGLTECLFSLNADIFYETLKDSGFSEDERTRLVGSCFRVAASRRWVTRTDFSTKSRRNSSNLQHVWLSNLFEKRSKDRAELKGRILAVYSALIEKGLFPPDRLGRIWLKVRTGLQ